MEAPVDFESKLLAGVHALASGATESSHTADVAEATQPEPATTEGTTPAAAPEDVSVPVVSPDQASEGSTPQDQPAPAETSTSAREALAKRGYKIDDEKLAAEHLRIESELAAIRRAEKKAKEAPAADPVAATPPQPAVAPAAVAPVSVPEPPVQPVAASVDVDVRVKEAVEADVECRALVEQYTAVRMELQQIQTLDRNGRVVGGRVAELDQEIADLQRILRPSEYAKKRGIEVPEMDAMARQDLERAIGALKLEKFDAINEYNAKAGTLRSLDQNFRSRQQQFVNHFAQQAQAARAEAEYTAEVAQLQASFTKNWPTNMAAAFKAHNVPDDLKPRIEKAIRTAAMAHPGVIPMDELSEFMSGVIKDELETADIYHRSKSAEYAKAKEADVKRAQPGPTGKAAVATPAKTETEDWAERLKHRQRAVMKNVHA